MMNGIVLIVICDSIPTVLTINHSVLQENSMDKFISELTDELNSAYDKITYVELELAKAKHDLIDADCIIDEQDELILDLKTQINLLIEGK